MRTIRFHDTDLQFPEACAVCLNWPHQRVRFDKTFIFGNGSQILSLQVPLCSQHQQHFLLKSSAQKWCRRLAMVGAGIVFAASVAGLLLDWAYTGETAHWWNFPLALVFGLCFGFSFWAVVFFWVEPLFASPLTKAVRSSVSMLRFDPYRPLLDVRFENDTFAELTSRQNLSILDVDASGLKCYHLEAAIHSDDIRLNGSLETNVLLARLPSEAEARSLLEPSARVVMARNLGEGCFYEILVTGIKEISQPRS
jgi:hypothetical protein